MVDGWNYQRDRRRLSRWPGPILISRILPILGLISDIVPVLDVVSRILTWLLH